MSFIKCLGMLLATALLAPVSTAAETGAAVQATSWGRIFPAASPSAPLQLEITNWPASGRLGLPLPAPSVVGAVLLNDTRRVPLSWVFNADATQLELQLPGEKPAGSTAKIELEAAESTRQFDDGRIVFSAKDAQVHGATAKLESHPGNYRVGFWTNPQDFVTWEYKPTRWGRYAVDLVFSADGGAGTEITVQVGSEKLTTSRPSTGSWYQYQTLSMGSIYLAQGNPFTVRVGCAKLLGAAVMNLKAVILRPAPEGEPSGPDTTGAITLRAGNATTHSVRMRYEPQTNKNCLGYWVEPSDWADWNFGVTEAGVFEIEVWQGCGKGHGGSTVAVEVAGQRREFIVADTGHFQAFIPRSLGRVELSQPGRYQLAIRPVKKAGGAVMDIRQIRLIPVLPESKPSPLMGARRVVFLGDSITYAGEWIEFAEALLRWRHPQASVDWINMGLPSETLSGLSEPGHAGGSFPRPDVHERLGRVLEKARPDVLVACYGMNDGIYYPYGEDRAAKFREGIQRLRDRAAAAGARVIHVTPPTFDPVPIKRHTLPAGLAEYRSPFEGYNGVLDRYASWLVERRGDGWEVVDIHAPMNAYLAQRRTTEPNFLLAGDGVHASTLGHWRIAREFVRHLEGAEMESLPETPEGLATVSPRLPEILKQVQARQRAQKDAWLTAVGHVRPGMSRGQPFETAQQTSIRHAAAAQAIASRTLPGEPSNWNGFERFDFPVNGRTVTVVAPRHEAPGRPWAWHGEFFGHKPNPDIALLDRGFHVVYLSVPDLLGAPPAVQQWEALYRELTTRYGFARRPALVGLSRGGLYCYNWATAHPDQVSCIYGDAPVCDFKSWPGAFGKGKRSDGDWRLVLQHYGFKNDEEARAYRGNPVDSLAGLAAAKVPLLHVYGDADEVVPWDENTGVIADRYKALGGSITLIAKAGVKHHPHGLDDSTPIVDFIWKHTASTEAQAYFEKRHAIH